MAPPWNSSKKKKSLKSMASTSSFSKYLTVNSNTESKNELKMNEELDCIANDVELIKESVQKHRMDILQYYHNFNTYVKAIEVSGTQVTIATCSIARISLCIIAIQGLMQVAFTLFIPDKWQSIASVLLTAVTTSYVWISLQSLADSASLSVPKVQRAEVDATLHKWNVLKQVPYFPSVPLRSCMGTTTESPVNLDMLDMCNSLSYDEIEEIFQRLSKERRTPEVQDGIEEVQRKGASWLLPHMMKDEAFLDRFVRGYKCEVEPCLNALKQYVGWYKEFNIQNLNLSYPPAPVRKYRNIDDDLHLKCSEPYTLLAHKFITHAVHGRDKSGRPVYYARVGLADARNAKKDMNVSDWLNWHFQHNEHIFNVITKEIYLETGIYVEDSVIVYDLKDLCLAHRHLKSFLLESAKWDQIVFPERLKKLFIVNTPTFFMIIWKVVKAILDPATLDKITILGSVHTKELLEWIDVDDLPLIYGGNCECPSGCVPLASCRVNPSTDNTDKSIFPRSKSEDSFLLHSENDGIAIISDSSSPVLVTCADSVNVLNSLSYDEIEEIFQRLSKERRTPEVQDGIEEVQRKGASWLLPHMMKDDAFLDRFVRGYKCEVEPCLNALKQYVRWYKEFNIQNLNLSYPPAPVRKYRNIDDSLHLKCSESYTLLAHKFITHAVHGRDKSGRPVYYARAGLADARNAKKDMNVSDWLNWHFQHNEHIFNVITKEIYRETGIYVEDSVIVYDLKDLCLAHRHLKSFLLESAKWDQIVFPERLKKLFIINTPTFFMSLWKIVKKIIDPATLNKITILGSCHKAELLEWIDIEDLPSIYGGRCCCKNDCIPLANVHVKETRLKASQSDEDFFKSLDE